MCTDQYVVVRGVGAACGNNGGAYEQLYPRGCVVVLLWANRVEKRAGRCEAGVGAVVPTKRCLYPFVNVGVMRGSRVGLVESEEEELSSDSCS